jgi:hypothetical protein
MGVQSVLLGSEAVYFGGNDRGQRLSDRNRIISNENLARSQYLLPNSERDPSYGAKQVPILYRTHLTSSRHLNYRQEIVSQ